ncbi:hypothetical protein F9L33_14615 [Amylibacter sp. SFDW26]|uniref:hypothetical protein n=1 Tax=Amylibacter sp. SFDW26 TaxID=2652722 RepID=UPI0012613D8B|nr:hypothetical protein [Amylibacter sp. SFDW26]KAB7610126.1 hypothetical protein F9L33_14615 [Amylibacter sp. SFDW26]
MTTSKHFFTSLLVVFCLVGCTERSMTKKEVAYIDAFHGETVDTESIIFARGLRWGVRNVLKDIRSNPEMLKSIQENNIDLKDVKSSLLTTAAVVVGNKVYFRSDIYLDDFGDSPFETDRALVGHEVTHVWQWQNRQETGYNLFKVVSEHIKYKDPYYYDIIPGQKYGEYRFEQQAEMVEDYLLLRLTDPHGNKTKKLANVLSPAFPNAVK